MRVATIILNWVIGLLFIGLFYAGLGVLFDSYSTCQDRGTETQLAVSWSPIGGCTAIVLGTKIRLG